VTDPAVHRPALVAAFATALATAPAQLTAQVDPGPPPHIAATKHGLTLPAGDYTVVELVEATAHFLCRNYLYDPVLLAAAKGFTLQRPIAVDALGSEEMLYALLASRDFAIWPLDEHRGLFHVVPLGENQRPSGLSTATPWRMPDEILRRPRLREIVMTAIDLEHGDCQQLAGLLRTAFAAQGPWRPGMLTATGSAPHTLILHGYREQVANAILLARRYDRACTPPPPPSPPNAPDQRLLALERQVAELQRQVADLTASKGRATAR
jgi:hypothetical protein